MKNVQFVLNQQQDLISVFQVVMHVKERFLKTLVICYEWNKWIFK